MIARNPEPPFIYAWVGEDEFGSGKVGLKQAGTPAGVIPLAAVDLEKMDQDYLRKALQQQATTYGKTIRLVRFRFEEVEVQIDP
jgi:hypothetical protein